MFLYANLTIVGCLRLRSVVVITSASHAEGRQFEPGRRHISFSFSLQNKHSLWIDLLIFFSFNFHFERNCGTLTIDFLGKGEKEGTNSGIRTPPDNFSEQFLSVVVSCSRCFFIL